MPVVVTIRDESTGGDRSAPIELTFPSEQMTVREIIRERIYQEVQDYNRALTASTANPVFRGLVQPSHAQIALNGARKGGEIDWREQFAKACDAFTNNRVLVLVGDRQTESLDQVITLSRGVEVVFLKLVLLVGG